MLRTIFGFAVLFSFASAASARPVTVNGGLWEGQLTVSTDVYLNEQPLEACIEGDTAELTTDNLFANVEPQGTCEILEEQPVEGGTNYKVACTGGMVNEGDITITSTATTLHIAANVILQVTEDLAVPGNVFLRSENIGACPAP
jgi:hypothetical protein